MSVELSLDMNRIHAYVDLQKAEIMEPFHRNSTMFDTALKPFGMKGVCTEVGPNVVAGKLKRDWNARSSERQPLMSSGTAKQRSNNPN